ncbi:MAG: TIGR03118 family protein, partial [Candidatus Acidiferrales bacterium]
MNFPRKIALPAALLIASSVPSIMFAQNYIQTNLVTDAVTTATALTIDPNLKNPWGITRSPSSPFWVGDNNAGISTLYNGAGTPQALVVKIPGPNGSPANFVSAPTGVVFNGAAAEFELTPGNAATAAKFMFVTEDGTISAWAGGAAATIEVDNSANPTAADGAVYKGATIAEYKGNFYLYVTNFRSGHVEVYDTNFNRVTLFNDDDDHHHDWSDDHHHDHFGDRFDDRIPRGFAPFNIQNIGGSLFVTYAKQDKAKHDDVAGTGNGFVDIYTPGGRLESRL